MLLGLYQIRMLLTQPSNIFSPNNIFSDRYQCTKKEKRKDRDFMVSMLSLSISFYLEELEGEGHPKLGSLLGHAR